MATKAKLLELLTEIYNDQGPRGWKGKTSIVIPPAEYAEMDFEKIEKTWDFSGRWLMHKIAKAIREPKTGVSRRSTAASAAASRKAWRTRKKLKKS